MAKLAKWWWNLSDEIRSNALYVLFIPVSCVPAGASQLDDPLQGWSYRAMNRGSQIRLLLWKNWTLRKRQKVKAPKQNTPGHHHIRTWRYKLDVSARKISHQICNCYDYLTLTNRKMTTMQTFLRSWAEIGCCSCSCESFTALPLSTKRQLKNFVLNKRMKCCRLFILVKWILFSCSCVGFCFLLFLCSSLNITVSHGFVQIRVLVEVFWPVLLFVGLVWLRKANPLYQQHECEKSKLSG